MLIEANAYRHSKIKTIGMRSFVRVSTPLAVLLYCASFQWSYVRWISPTWGYMGLTYNKPDPTLLLIAYVLAALLCVLSPLKLSRTSQIIYWILFFTVYVPGMLAPLFLQLDSALTLLLLELSLTGGMLFIALSYRLKLVNIGRYPFGSRLFWLVFVSVFALSNAMLLIAFRGNLHLATLKEVYDVRAGAGAVQLQNPGIGYVSSLLSNVMNPFWIAYGLTVHRRSLVVLGILGQVLVYATAAMKSVLFSPVFIILIYYSVKKNRGGLVPKFGLLCCAMFVVLTALVGVHTEGLVFNLATITLVRSFSIPGVEIGEYQYFFGHFPQTHFSHIHGVNLLVSNPYSMSLGQEIGYFYAGAGSNGRIGNANADFFAMDGIAGFGLTGILIMGIVCAMMFWVLDSCAKKHPIEFSTAVLASCAISLTNNSLFSSFLGGGIMLFMLLFVVIPRDMFAGDSTESRRESLILAVR